MLCPTCHHDGYEPARPVVRDDSEYRAGRRIEAAETVANFRSIADQREAAGRLHAAAVWRQEAAKLETECARVWGTPKAAQPAIIERE